MENTTLLAALSFSPLSLTTNPTTNKTMANYYATARSNYFAVKDETAFRQWADGLNLTILGPNHRNKVADGIDRFGITPDEFDEGGWPNFRHNEETSEDDDDFDLFDELAAHLADDEVAILMEVGNEKLRYLTGTVLAINNKGETVSVNLESIYESARDLGCNITAAEY